MKHLRAFGKIVLAGIVAIAILSVLISVYFLMPLHYTNKLGNTDYVWEANKPWMSMTEGISWGRFDANGFNNLKVVENPDIVILGSSHMEAMNVLQKETMSNLLCDKLNGAYSVYNMGISGHDFYKVCKYLPKTLRLNERAPQVVVIETSTVDLTQKRVEDVINGTVSQTKSNEHGIIAKLQKSPFLRLVYHQLTGGLLELFLPESSRKKETVLAVMPGDNDVNSLPYEQIFQYISEEAKAYGTEIIVMYHPRGTLQKDGSVSFNSEAGLEIFSNTAAKYGIHFVDLTSGFEEMYKREHKVPHGFMTGELMKGHLNKNGHAVAAEFIYDMIITLEKEGRICQ